MAVEERQLMELEFARGTVGRKSGLIDVIAPQGPAEAPYEVGGISVEILEGNIVVTIRRIDEAYFGPVSLVVV